MRMSALVLAMSLAAPYLFVYDLTILAPVWIWLVDWFLTCDVPPAVGVSLRWLSSAVGCATRAVRARAAVSPVQRVPDLGVVALRR